MTVSFDGMHHHTAQSSDNQGKSLVNTNPVGTDGGCIIPLNNKPADELLNADHGDWRQTYQEHLYSTHHRLCCFPSQFEIEHTCGNRACCNVEHFEPVPRKGLIERNRRADEENQMISAWFLWQWTGCSMAELGEAFGIPDDVADDWIAQFEEPLERASQHARALGLEA